jgi:hypothetical protein
MVGKTEDSPDCRVGYHQPNIFAALASSLEAGLYFRIAIGQAPFHAQPPITLCRGHLLFDIPAHDFLVGSSGVGLQCGRNHYCIRPERTRRSPGASGHLSAEVVPQVYISRSDPNIVTVLVIFPDLPLMTAYQEDGRSSGDELSEILKREIRVPCSFSLSAKTVMQVVQTHPTR